MAQAIAYKNVALATEASYGTSLPISDYAPVKSIDLNVDPNFQLKEDTSTSVKGYDRSAYLRNVIEGSIDFNVDPESVHHWLELGMGVGATLQGGAALPISGATAVTYPQNEDGVQLTYRIDIDRNTATEGFLGVAAQSLELTSSGDFVEGTLNVTAKEKFSSTTFTPTGLTLNPFVFAESALYVGGSIGGASTEISVDEWTMTYDLQSETAFQSGSRAAKRVDPKVPMLTGSFTRFFDDTNYDTYVTNGTDRAFVVELTGSNTYSGTSPYKLAFYIPKARCTVSTKTYEAAGYVKETVEFTGVYDPGIAYLWKPVLWNGATVA